MLMVKLPGIEGEGTAVFICVDRVDAVIEHKLSDKFSVIWMAGKDFCVDLPVEKVLNTFQHAIQTRAAHQKITGR